MSFQHFKKSLIIISEMLHYRMKTDPGQYTKAYEGLENYLRGRKSNYNQNKNMTSDFNENLIVLDFDTIRIIFNLDEKWDPMSIAKKFKQPIVDGLMQTNDVIENFGRRKDGPTMKRVICVLSHPNTYKTRGNPPMSMLKKDPVQNPKDTQGFIASLGLESELFHINSLQYNVLQHSLVPVHEIVTGQDEKESVKKNYQVNDFRLLPLILTTDPVVRFIGGKANDLIRIIRNPDHVGEHVFYRYCVMGA